MGRGLLHFTIRSASNLHKHDVFGRQQPYCHIVCGQYSNKTKTCKDGGQHPVWNETLFFQLNNETQVEITIYVEQRIGKDAVLGTAVVPIVTVRTTGHQELSVPVMRKDKQSGVLQVCMEFKGPAMSQYGQIGQVAHTRPSGPPSLSSSFTSHQPNAPTATPSLDPSVRLASIPIRLLQQPASPLLPPQQQQQQQQMASSFGSHAGSTSDPADLAAAAAAAAEARQLVLQRQRSVMGPPGRQNTTEAVAVQQYSQQLQQLQALHAQLLSSLPPEQQQIILQQQQRAAESRSSPGTAATAAADHKLQLPKQPKKTAADLFMPDQQQIAGSSGSSDWQQQPSSDMPICDLLRSGDAASVPCKFDINRLQAIIDKVYPGEEAAGAAAGSTAASTPQQQHHQLGLCGRGDVRPVVVRGTECAGPDIESVGLGGFGGAAGLAAAAAAVAAAGHEEDQPPAAAALGSSTDVIKGSSTSLGGDAATAAGAANAGAAAVGARVRDCTAGSLSSEPLAAAAVPVTDCYTDISSIGLGGFGGAAGFAAAAAAAADAHDPAAAAAAAETSGSAAATSLPEAAMVEPLPATAATAGSMTPSIRSALTTPATTLPYSSSGHSTDLAVALSNVSVASSLTGTKAPTAAAAVGLPGDQTTALFTAVLADKLESVRRSAPLLTQPLDLAAPDALPPSLPAAAAAAPGDEAFSPVPPAAVESSTIAAGPAAHSGSSSSSARVLELEGLLHAAYQDQIRLTVLLHERDRQMQLLLQQFLHSQQQLALLQARLAHIELQQQQQGDG